MTATKKYTREELEALKRWQLRTVATEQFGMPDSDAGSLKAAQMIEYVLKKQAGKGAPVEEEEEEAAEERPRRGRPPGRKVAPREEEPEEDQQEEPEEEEAPRGRKGPAPRGQAPKGPASRRPAPRDEEEAESATEDKLDIIGKEIDGNHAEVMDVIKDLNQVAYILYNLIGDIYNEHFDPGELERRVEKLRKEFEGK